jgi:choline kinase
MLLILAYDELCEIDFQFIFNNNNNNNNKAFSLYSWKQNHNKFSFIWLYQNISFEHNSLFFLLSLLLGCGTHLSDKIITWMTPQKITLS